MLQAKFRDSVYRFRSRRGEAVGQSDALQTMRAASGRGHRLWFSASGKRQEANFLAASRNNTTCTLAIAISSRNQIVKSVVRNSR